MHWHKGDTPGQWHDICPKVWCPHPAVSLGSIPVAGQLTSPGHLTSPGNTSVHIPGIISILVAGTPGKVVPSGQGRE